MTGFIKLHRKLISWGRYTDDVTKTVFIHLLLTANFKQTAWQNITLKPGQVITSTKKLSEQLQHTNQQTRTALNKLKSTGEITIESTNRFSLITIVNWEKYQAAEEGVNKQKNRRNNKQTTSKQHAARQANQQQRKNKKNKECKECKEVCNESADFNGASTEKIRCGKHGNVLLTPSQLEEILLIDNGATLERFSEKIFARGYKYDDHYRAIMSWYEEDSKRQRTFGAGGGKPQKKQSPSYDMSLFEARAEELPVYQKRGG